MVNWSSPNKPYSVGGITKIMLGMYYANAETHRMGLSEYISKGVFHFHPPIVTWYIPSLVYLKESPVRYIVFMIIVLALQV